VDNRSTESMSNRCRMVRGGDYFVALANLTPAYREDAFPNFASGKRGFRLARNSD
jgi:hypothetical protein